jgi:predicted enzyme related to lactoylglutathione lyase
MPSRNLMFFGWYMRRTPSIAALLPFYRDILKLPLIRVSEKSVAFFWGGESTIFELKGDVSPNPARDSDPATAPMTPVFATPDLPRLLGRLAQSGVTPLATSASTSDTFVLDSDRQLVGFRQIAQRAGSDFNPGCDAFPTDISGLVAIVRRVTDVRKNAAFYQGAFDLKSVGTDPDVNFDLGEGITLEVRPGGQPVRIPADRGEITNSLVMRVENHDQWNARLKSKGARIVNDRIQFNSAELTYAADADGQIFGFEERYEPPEYRTPREPFLEDLEAERRWAQRK